MYRGTTGIAVLAWLTIALRTPTRARPPVGRSRSPMESARPIHIRLRPTQGSLPVDARRQLAAEIGIGDCLKAGRQRTRIPEGIDPELPVLAAHDRHGRGRFRIARGLQNDVADGVVVEIQGLDAERIAEGFDRRAELLASPGVGPHRRGKAVDQKVDLAEVVYDRLDHLVAQLVGKGIAVESACVPSPAIRSGFEGPVVVPARRCRSGCRGYPLQGHPHGRRAATEPGGDPGREAEAARTAEYQGLVRTPDFSTPLHEGDLPIDVGAAASGVRGGTDEAANTGFDDHR